MRQTPIRLLMTTTILLGIGCSTDEPTAPPSEPEPRPSFEISLSTTIPAGGEVFRCRYMTLPEGTHDIDRFEHNYTSGSHHILLYPTSLTPQQAAAMPSDFDCTTVGDLGQSGISYGASDEPSGFQEFPPGVGLRFESEQVILLEAHYINATDQSLDATVSVRLFPAEEPVTVAAGNLFFYNYAILIPPSPSEAISAMSCEIPVAVNLQFAASHMHRRGTFFTSSLVPPSGEATTLHETFDWESAEPGVFEPALKVEAGSRIDFHCEYRNDIDQTVIQGESADVNEMCIFIASYWPKQSDAVEACIGGSSGPVLSGDATCLETLTCVGNATSEIAAQECIASGCRTAGPPLNSLLACIEIAECTTDACIETNCGAEYLACQADTCSP